MFIQPAICTVTLFAGNFAPQGWLFCQGQELPISDYTAVYSILGNTFGGDGVQTFALPDLRGRVAVHAGQGPGLGNYIPGQQGGAESIIFTGQQLGGHTHPVVDVTLAGPPASSQPGTIDTPTGNVPAQLNGNPAAYSTAQGAQNLGVVNCYTPSGPAGEDTPDPVDVLSPYLTMNYIICMDGVYPTQG